MYFRLWLPMFFLSIHVFTTKVNAGNQKDSSRDLYLEGLQVLATPNLKATEYEQVLSYFEKAKAEAATNKEEADLYHLSILGLARVYYEMAYAIDANDTRRSIFLNRSIAEYRSIPRFSPRWPEALFEQAWAYTIIEDYQGALGALYSLKDPYFALGFFPELNVLEAIIYWRNCHFDKAEQALQTFQSSYASLLQKNKTQGIIDEIEALQIRAQIISLEIKSAQASLLEREKALLSTEKKEISRSYVVGPDHFFWGVSPKERWIDELGYYRIAIKSLCYE